MVKRLIKTISLENREFMASAAGGCSKVFSGYGGNDGGDLGRFVKAACVYPDGRMEVQRNFEE